MKYDNKFFVFPDDDTKEMIITASKPGRTLKIGIKEAMILADVIRQQIQEWERKEWNVNGSNTTRHRWRQSDPGDRNKSITRGRKQ